MVEFSALVGKGVRDILFGWFTRGGSVEWFRPHHCMDVIFCALDNVVSNMRLNYT